MAFRVQLRGLSIGAICSPRWLGAITVPPPRSRPAAQWTRPAAAPVLAPVRPAELLPPGGGPESRSRSAASTGERVTVCGSGSVSVVGMSDSLRGTDSSTPRSGPRDHADATRGAVGVQSDRPPPAIHVVAARDQVRQPGMWVPCRQRPSAPSPRPNCQASFRFSTSPYILAAAESRCRARPRPRCSRRSASCGRQRSEAARQVLRARIDRRRRNCIHGGRPVSAPEASKTAAMVAVLATTPRPAATVPNRCIDVHHTTPAGRSASGRGVFNPFHKLAGADCRWCGAVCG